MSVDGKKFSETLRLESEGWIEVPCSQCARDGKNLPAIKYCVECDENFCSSCLMHHNKFLIMKAHQITDNLSSRTEQRPQLPTERCGRHGGKLVDVYCPTHDVVGCSTCINVEHEISYTKRPWTDYDISCRGIQYIPDMTQDLQLSKEISDLESKLQHLMARLDYLKKQKQDQLKLLQQEKDKRLKDIQALRKRINDKLNEMEKTVINEVDAKIGARVRDVNQDIDVISNQKTTLEKRQKSVENAKSSNKAELFNQLKMGQADVQKTEHNSHCTLSEAKALKLKLFPDFTLQRLLETKVTSLGNISEILAPKHIIHDRDVNVRLPVDQHRCRIRAICLTADGDVYFADSMNNRIKKLDQSYAVTEHLDLPDNTFGLCEVDNTFLAVTLAMQKKVQIVSRNPLTLRESFTVGDRCRGIYCHNGFLYVCCVGYEGEGPGCIEVYSVGGDLLRSYYQGTSWPFNVHVSERGDLFISNKGSIGLVTLRMTDHRVSDMQINALRYPAGVCRVGDNLLCVAGVASNNIVLISEDGEHQQELLTQRDEISKPFFSVCFDKNQSRLIVSFFEADNIKIYYAAT